jgi:hypothetical protein
MIRSRIKKLILQLPVLSRAYSYLNRNRNYRKQIDVLLNLFNEGRIVVLHPYAGLTSDIELIRNIAQEVTKDYLEVYGSVQINEMGLAANKFPVNAVLLRQPLALIRLPATHDEYLKLVGDKTRNMIRKADRNGYEIREFVWNDYLQDIFEINTSKEIRSSGAMHGWYTKPVQERNHGMGEKNYRKYYGAFKDGKLRAYLNLVLCGDHAFFKHFIGNAEHLNKGVMNSLISWTVKRFVGHPTIQWFKYGALPDGAVGSVYSFRKHAGFRGYATFLDLEEPETDMQLLSKINSLIP